MDFDRRKLNLDEQNSLIEIEIEKLVPLRPLGTVVYLRMEQNKKLLAIKGPFDFFTPDELQKLSAHKKLYAHPILESVQRIQRIAERVRSVLAWQEAPEGIFLEPAPYEISFSLRSHLSAVWRKVEQKVAVETYFLPFFMEELCGSFTSEAWIRFRSEDFPAYERALILTDTTLFLAMNCGYHDVGYLKKIREELLLETLAGVPKQLTPEIRELNSWVKDHLSDNPVGRLHQEDFESGAFVATSKIFAKLGRLDRPLIELDEESVFGPRGLIGVDSGKESDAQVA